MVSSLIPSYRNTTYSDVFQANVSNSFFFGHQSLYRPESVVSLQPVMVSTCPTKNVRHYIYCCINDTCTKQVRVAVNSRIIFWGEWVLISAALLPTLNEIFRDLRQRLQANCPTRNSVSIYGIELTIHA